MVADRGPAGPTESEGDMAEQVRECEVVVVGAGYSGLAAARHLARSGVDVLVLDARHRVGGRSFTDVTAAGFTIDRGGQWIGPTQDHLAALATELGIATFPTYTTGEGVELRDGGRDTYVGLIPTSDPHGRRRRHRRHARPRPGRLRRPGRRPVGRTRRRQPGRADAGHWFDAHLSSASARAILEVAVKAVFGTGSGELSLLFTLFYLHAGGGLTNLARSTGGAQERRFAGGSQQLAEGMADELGDAGAPRRPGRDGGLRPRRRWSSGAVWSPRATTRPTPRQSTARWASGPAAPSSPCRPRSAGASPTSPPLPGRRDQLCQRMPMGAVTKIHVIYDRPFWRDDGLNGQIVAARGALGATFDNSPEDAAHGEIVGFIAGDDCRRLEARRARRAPGGRAGRARARLRAPGARADRGGRAALARRAVHPRRARRHQLARAR